MAKLANKIFFFYALLYFLAIFASPIFTAQAAGLVPCQGLDCKFCSLIQLVNNIINYALRIAVILTVVFVVLGGFTIMIARDDPKKMESGKNMIKSAVIGLVISLSAWLILREVLTILTGNPSFRPWNFGNTNICGQ